MRHDRVDGNHEGDTMAGRPRAHRSGRREHDARFRQGIRLIIGGIVLAPVAHVLDHADVGDLVPFTAWSRPFP
ncbi:hypothetical protein ALI22I_20415 [Saccharothrix sp. ALI-22-I]|nr:hypothetical protein ALI22I_20415 [Saccharothrix sp. ALI-22-I]